MKKQEIGRVEHATSNGPLGQYSREFRSHLERQLYAPATIAEYDRCIGALCHVMWRCHVNAELLSGNIVQSLIRKVQKTGSCRRRSAPFIVKSFVRYLIEKGIANPFPPVTDNSIRGQLRREYEDYLRHQRGLSERTIYHCWRFADRFLQFRSIHTDEDLKAITPLDIVRFMQSLTSGSRPRRNKALPTHLRNFFLFLFKSGRTNVNLAPSVPRIAQRRVSNLPRFLSPEQVETLIAAVKEDTPIGRRNYAMVLLLARLGLRATEVVAIRIDDIDWRAGELLVRGKGQLHDRLPIPKDVGEALANYIQRDRGTTSRALFVTQRAPRVAFADPQILNTVLTAAFEKTGLKPPTRYIGSHILRHSLATNMVRQGVSLSEIGDVLRHRDRASTMIYAKLDVEGLRSIAPAWPVSGGVK